MTTSVNETPKNSILIFDISKLSDDIRTPSRQQPWADIAIAAYSAHFERIEVTFWAQWYGDLSKFNTIELTGEDYLQFLLIQHLPWEAIIDYFSNQTN